jgi:hypothetical protein
LPPSSPAPDCLAIALFLLSGAALFSGGNLSLGEREDRADRWVIIAFAVIGLLSAYLPAYRPEGVLDRRRGFHAGCACSSAASTTPTAAARHG